MSDALGKYMRIEEVTALSKRKTSVWIVEGSDGLPLGQIRWYSAWRCYTFWPLGTAVLNATCLADLERFTRGHTAAHRAALTEAPEANE